MPIPGAKPMNSLEEGDRYDIVVFGTVPARLHPGN